MGEVSDYGKTRGTWDPSGTAKETATDQAAENRSTPENPQVDLPNSADIPQAPATDQDDRAGATTDEDPAAGSDVAGE